MNAQIYISLLLSLVALSVASLRVVKPCAQAVSARPSMQIKFSCPYRVFLQLVLMFTLHSVDMCGSLVRHVKTKLRCSSSFRLVLVFHPP